MTVRALCMSLTVLALGLVASCEKADVGFCPPAGAHAALQAIPKNSAPAPLTIYWDGSESIAGYVDGATAAVRTMGDLQPLLASHAKERGALASWYRFGTVISDRPLVDASALATTGFYRCSGCDNRESRIDAVLSRIADRKGPGLDIVVTDLWLSNKAYQGTSQIALGQPIRDILRSGRTIGLMGLRVPYAGPVYDVPGIGIYRGAKERPLFVILIGDRLEVLAAYKRLAQSGSTAFNGMQFSMFGSEPAQPWVGTLPGVVAKGVRSETILDSPNTNGLLQVRVSLEDMRKDKAAIVLPMEATQRLLPGAIWRGELVGRTKVWRRSTHKAKSKEACKVPQWIEQPALSAGWNPLPAGKPGKAFVLDASSTRGLVAGGDYLIQVELTSQSLADDHPETRWLKSWGFPAEQTPVIVAKAPDFFPTMNLAALADQLEGGLRDSAQAGGLPLVTTAILVRVDP